MTAPDWLNEAIRAFGRQMALHDFALNARGAAGARFENGVSLRLEYAAESLVMSVGVKMPSDEGALKRLLTGAHPSAVPGFAVRAVLMERNGEGLYAVRIPERQVDVSILESVFRVLWQLATGFGKAVS